MVDGDTAVTNTVTGYVRNERVTLSTTPTGTTYQWALSRPAGSSAARCYLSATDTAAPTFTPDIEGEYLVTCTVDGTTAYTISATVLDVAISNTVQVMRLSPLADASVPTPASGVLNVFNSSALGEMAVKNSAGAVQALSGINQGVYNVIDYGASPSATAAVNVAAIQAALTAAGAAGGARRVDVPAGEYNCDSGTITIPSGVTLEGAGRDSVLLNAYITATGTVGAAIAFTAPAAKGATTISVPATGLTNTWLRLASCINSLSPDAGIDQLGNEASQHSYLAEFAQIKTGNVATAVLYAPTLWPYSNTPGPDSDPAFATSVACPVTFHEGGRISNLTLRGRQSTQSHIVVLAWCRGFALTDCTIDANNDTTSNVWLEYCLDCHLRGCTVIGKRTDVPSGSAANQLIIASCTNCTANDCTFEGGNQTIDVTYRINNTRRGGPSIACGAIGCRALHAATDGFTDHAGSWSPFWVDCTVIGVPQGFRIRSRGSRVVNGRSFSMGSTMAGVLVQDAAVFDSLVADNTTIGSLYGVQWAPHASAYAEFCALLSGGACSIERNRILDAAGNGIKIDAAPVSASLIGPRVCDNEITSPAADGIVIENYANGTYVAENRIRGIATTRYGIRWATNIARLRVDRNHVYGVAGGGYALGGPGVGSMMTDAVTFPSGEADAYLFIGLTFTDAATPFASILRNNAAYTQPLVAGWQPFAHGIGNAAPTLERSSLGAWIDSANGLAIRWNNSANAAFSAYLYTGAGSPEAAVTAPKGALYFNTSGGAGVTLYVKESGTGNTGWIAK